MNYQKIHDQLIERAKKENRKKNSIVYYENHHIVPRCLGGTNDKENLVLLTAREHFLAHWLLVRIYPENKKIFYAWHRISYSKIKNRRNFIKLTSRIYEELRINHSKFVKLHFKDKKLSEKTKEKISLSKKGKSISSKGVKKTKEHISNIPSLFKKGNIPWNKGIKLSNESKEKISKKLKEYFRYNENKFKNKKHSKESNLKNSIAHKGKIPANAEKIYIYDNNNKLIEIFDSISKCALKYNLSKKNCAKSYNEILNIDNKIIKRERFLNNERN